MIVVSFSLGVLTWSLLEYCLHRFLGHDARTRPNAFASEHTRHHSQGDYFAPAWKKALVTFGAIALVTPPAVAIAGRSLGAAYAAGLVGFYLAYETLHRLEHVWAGIGPYARWARRHHFFHHFVDPQRNHGVTSPLWDFVFGTYSTPGEIPVPAQLAMPWLTDPATGALRPELVGTYSIRSSKRAA